MDGLALLVEARAAGLEVRAEGDRLVIRGPRKAEALAKRLLANKPSLLPLLSDAPSNKEQVEYLIASVTRCQRCGRIDWRRNPEGGWTCGNCHPEQETR